MHVPALQISLTTHSSHIHSTMSDQKPLLPPDQELQDLAAEGSNSEESAEHSTDIHIESEQPQSETLEHLPDEGTNNTYTVFAGV